MAFTKPSSWEEIGSYVYRHPNGLILRGLNHTDEAIEAGGLCVLSSDGYMYVVFGRDMVNELSGFSNDAAQWAAFRGGETGGPESINFITFDANIEDVSTLEGIQATDAGATTKLSRMTQVGAASARANLSEAVAVFAVPSVALAGRGFFHRDDTEPTYIHCGPGIKIDGTTATPNMFQICHGPVSVHRFVLNMSNEDFIDALGTSVDEADQPEVVSKVNSAKVKMTTLLGSVLDQQATMTIVAQSLGGRLHMMKRLFHHVNAAGGTRFNQIKGGHITPHPSFNPWFSGVVPFDYGMDSGDGTIVPYAVHQLGNSEYYAADPLSGFCSSGISAPASWHNMGTNTHLPCKSLYDDSSYMIPLPARIEGIPSSRIFGPMDRTFDDSAAGTEWSFAQLVEHSFDMSHSSDLWTKKVFSETGLLPTESEYNAVVANMSSPSAESGLDIDQVSAHEIDVGVLAHLWQLCLSDDVVTAELIAQSIPTAKGHIGHFA